MIELKSNSIYNTDGICNYNKKENKMKKSFLFFVLCVCSGIMFSQNITNTLGTGGSFIIKDGANTFLTLDQSTGQVNVIRALRLENTSTSANLGVIFKGSDRFIHNYGLNNTFLGVNSGNFSMTGSNNTAVGMQSLISNTDGYWNTAIGVNSLYNNSSGYLNTAIGMASLQYNTSGYQNIALGVNALSNNTTGYQNTAVGVQSLFTNIDGKWNTAIGFNSLYFNNTGFKNTAVGLGALQYNTTGSNNTASGFNSLFSNTTGGDNTAIGFVSLATNTTGTSNTASGLYSLFSNTTGYANTASGNYSLQSNTIGNENTAFGHSAGNEISSGSNNTAIGFDAQVPNATSSNQVRIGNTNVGYAGVQVAWTITSDKRWKSDILNSNLGLDFISGLRPVSYFRNNDEKQRTEYGFIAQEVEEVLKEAGTKNAGMINIDDKGRYELRYNDLFAPIVKAIQELKSENDQLKAQLEDVKEIKEQLSEIKTLKEELSEQIKLLKTNNEDADVKFSSLGK